ncbi:Negative regulator of mitotic exit [Linnemannia elongata]|nr:Negative regulator of mitotic exit [Linnemannia elongata]
MGFATVNESTFYVHGGFTYRAQSQGTGSPDVITNQMFALDLTVPWNSARPAWSNVNSTNSLTIAWHSLSATKDQQQLFLWDSPSGGVFSAFNIQTATWTQNYTALNGRKTNGLRSAVNQVTGMIIVPSALYEGAQMFETLPPITTTTPSYSNLTMPAEIVGLTHYTFVWSTLRSAMLLYGGHYNNTQPNPVLRQFDNGQWTNVTTSGPSPGDVSSHCMIPAYNGARMVVFGGCDVGVHSNSNIFILDVQTMSWTQGTSAPETEARCNMACTVRGDYFIVWGGNSNYTVVDNRAPLIYNIREDKWVNQFSPILPTDGPPTPRQPTTPGSNPGPTNPTPNTSPSSSSNTAAIGGGVAGGVFILGLLMFLFYRRRRQGNSKSGYVSDSSETPLDGSAHRAPPSSTREDIGSPPYLPNQPWPVSSPPPLQPRPVSNQHEYIGMEPIVQAEPLASPTNHSGQRDSSLFRSPQMQNIYADIDSIDGKEPFAYDEDIYKDNNHRNSALFGPRNPQVYTPTATKKPHDPQYQPMSPTAIGQEFMAYPQRSNDPQGDGTSIPVVGSGAGGADDSGMEGLDLRQQIAYIQAQNQDIERMRMEQQEMLRKLQDRLDSQGKST